jgi:predicted kinase
MASLQNNLYLLCGIPGSGKSTLAWALSSNNVILLSSDSLRAIIGKDESDQAVSAQVFGTMEAMTEYFLRQGKDVAIDATNYNRKSRAANTTLKSLR